ncbi:hypothetical protein B0H11DRAFT_502857 [Mycena galericulata]|nr:hypothetical protein B0H11DRAFT_502857 [Mycena galericulata]
MSGCWRIVFLVSRYTMFSRADGFRIMGGTFNVNTHQPTTAHNQPNPYPPAVCASEIIARLESIERRITDFGRQVQVQVQAQEALEVDHADHCPFIPQNDVQYPFQKTAIDPGALYDMASREYLCQGDESSTSSTSSSILDQTAHSNNRPIKLIPLTTGMNQL